MLNNTRNPTAISYNAVFWRDISVYPYQGRFTLLKTTKPFTYPCSRYNYKASIDYNCRVYVCSIARLRAIWNPPNIVQDCSFFYIIFASNEVL